MSEGPRWSAGTSQEPTAGSVCSKIQPLWSSQRGQWTVRGGWAQAWPCAGVSGSLLFTPGVTPRPAHEEMDRALGAAVYGRAQVASRDRSRPVTLRAQRLVPEEGERPQVGSCGCSETGASKEYGWRPGPPSYSPRLWSLATREINLEVVLSPKASKNSAGQHLSLSP